MRRQLMLDTEVGALGEKNQEDPSVLVDFRHVGDLRLSVCHHCKPEEEGG